MVKPLREARWLCEGPIDPRARVLCATAAATVAPVRKPKPITTPAYTQTYAPTQIAPPPLPSQAVAVPPPPAAATQAVADDDGPVVRPPMPVQLAIIAQQHHRNRGARCTLSESA